VWGDRRWGPRTTTSEHSTANTKRWLAPQRPPDSAMNAQRPLFFCMGRDSGIFCLLAPAPTAALCAVAPPSTVPSTCGCTFTQRPHRLHPSCAFISAIQRRVSLTTLSG
jgi:hypothetical protein